MDTKITFDELPDKFEIVSVGNEKIKQPKSERKWNWEKALEGTLGMISNVDETRNFGIGKRVGGVVNAIGSYPVDRIAELSGVENTPTFSDRYNEIVEDVDTSRKNINASAPFSAAYVDVYNTFKNPVYKAGAKVIDKAGTLGKKMIAGGMVNSATAGVDDLLRSNEENIIDDAIAYGVAGTITPVLGAAGNAILRNVGKLSPSVNALGKKIDETQKNEQVKNLVDKYGEGFGNIEAIGVAAREPVNKGVELIERAKDMMYSNAWSLTDPQATADISKTVQVLQESLPHLTRGTQAKLKEFMAREVLPIVKKTKKGTTIKRITTEQLDGARSKFGEFVNEAGLGKAKTEKKIIDDIYFAMKEDFLNSVAENGAGQRARDSMEEAMNNFAQMMANRSDYQLIKSLANDKKSSSDLANQILKVLSSNKSDTEKLKMLERVDKNGDIKRSVAGFIRNATDFNKLSEGGKKFVYGKGVDEAEKAFNDTTGKKIHKVLNLIADKNKANSPYMLGLLRYLLNN